MVKWTGKNNQTVNMLQLKYFDNKLLYLLFLVSLMHFINIEILYFSN